MSEALRNALLGGVLIGASASLLWLTNGKRAGISGIVAGLLPNAGAHAAESAWNAWFIAGLLLGGLVLRLVWPAALGTAPGSLVWLIGAGLLVGVGTRLSRGCTSGHGVCGLAQGAKRSAVATLVFMLTGVLSVFVVRHLLGVGT